MLCPGEAAFIAGNDDDDDLLLFGYDDGTTAITVLTKVKVKKTLNWLEPLFVGSMLR
jgi:hypothetical protein